MGLDLPMPSHVKAFWRLSIVAIICWAIPVVWRLIILTASQHVLAAGAAQHHPYLPLIGMSIVATVSGVTFFTAWSAAARRRNWARWATAVLLLHDQIVLVAFAVLILVSGPRGFRTFMLITSLLWAGPWVFVIPTLAMSASIAAVVFVFSGNAREWFTPSAVAA